MSRHLKFVLISVVVIILGLSSSNVQAAVSGYGWSSNVGWFDFNSLNVNSSGLLSGYGWSPSVGWVSFNASDVSGCPIGPSCTASVNRSSGAVTGWARALSYVPRQDGWIDLSRITYSPASGALSGYAWNSDDIGWLQFNTNIGAVPGVPPCVQGSVNCPNPGIPPVIPPVVPPVVTPPCSDTDCPPGSNPPGANLPGADPGANPGGSTGGGVGGPGGSFNPNFLANTATLCGSSHSSDVTSNICKDVIRIQQGSSVYFTWNAPAGYSCVGLNGNGNSPSAWSSLKGPSQSTAFRLGSLGLGSYALRLSCSLGGETITSNIVQVQVVISQVQEL